MLFVSNRDISNSLASTTTTLFSRYGPGVLHACEITHSSLGQPPVASVLRKHPRNLLFVHGFNISLREALFSGLKLESLYGPDVVTFSWPSRIAGSIGRLPSTYWVSKYDAERSAEGLARAVLKMPERTLGQPFVVAAHSMGNVILKNAIHQLKVNGSWPVPQICRIVMIAADLPEQEHVSAFADVATETELHIVQNRHDYALLASSLMHGLRTTTRLGQLAHCRIRNAHYHDFSGQVGRSHSYFLDKNAEEGDVRDFFEFAFACAMTGR